MSSSESDHASKPEEGRPSERPPGRISTIIVDPALMAEAERLSESQRPPPPAPTNSASELSAHAQGHGDEQARDSDEGDDAELERLSVEDAERFATAFRASWEPPAPHSNGNGHDGQGQRLVAVKPVQAQHAPSVIAEPQPAPVHISELPGAKRGRTMALGAAAFAGFVAIAVLGWLASNSGVPDHPSADNPLAASPIADKPASKPTEAAPSQPPATAPSASPVPVPEVPVVAAAAPAAAAPEAALAAPEATQAAAPEITPEPALEPAPEQILVALQITTRPEGAQLTLDGSPIANPYDAMHPQGGHHVVEASAPGYRAQNLTIELTRKRSVALELEKSPAEKAAAKASSPRPKRPRPARASKPASTKKGAAFASESPY
jgi:hypothetical protein